MLFPTEILGEAKFSSADTSQSSVNRLSMSTETITLVALNRLLEWLSKIFSSNAAENTFDESALLANTKDRNNLAYIPRATFLLLLT